MALKYDRIKGNDYEKLMQSYRNSSENPDISNEKNLSVVEEYFVKDVTNFLQGKIDTLVDYGTFKNGINSALESLKLEPLVLDSENILSILNLNMGKIFNRQIGPMKAGLVLFESNFRD